MQEAWQIGQGNEKRASFEAKTREWKNASARRSAVKHKYKILHNNNVRII